MRHTRGLHHRLWVQIWLGFLAVLVAFALFSAGLFWLHNVDRPQRTPLAGFGLLLADLLPPPDAPAEVQQAVLARLHRQLHVGLALYDRFGHKRLTTGSHKFPDDLTASMPPHWHHWHRHVVRIDLPDGRVVLAAMRPPPGRLPPFVWLGLFALVAAFIAWAIARRLTRRLERLQTQVVALGQGDLSARVDVDGRDEIAELARHFNDAAACIQALVGAQRAMLAAASHELRSPLARIRMALELLDTGERPDLHARLEHDIGELDTLIEELLVASRLDSGGEPFVRKPVDLLSIAAEEAAQTSTRVEGKAVTIQGDTRLLRRAIHNLLENARRHVPAASVEVKITTAGNTACIAVCDRGPGVPKSERERVFEPFYRLLGTAESGSGVGLGLWLVRRIARQHGGDARCSEHEGGACFTIELPLQS
jgi:signal transduction histidine kinase